MTETTAKIATVTVSIALIIAAIYLYLLYFADILSTATGYFIGLVVLPILFGVAIGLGAALLLSRKENSPASKYYYIPLLCGLASVVPAAYVLLMTFLE